MQPSLSGRVARFLLGDHIRPWIDPARIRLKLPFIHRAERPRRFVLAAEEIAEPVLFAHTRTARAMADLWQHRADPTGSQLYRDLIERAARNDSPRKDGMLLDTREKIDAYCRHYVEMAESLSREGYREDLPGDRIGIAISASGEPMHLWHGNHRIALATLVGLRRVQVQVRYVHPSWVDACCLRFDKSPLSSIRRGLMELSAA